MEVGQLKGFDLKKIAIVVAVISSSSAFSGTMGSVCDSVNVTTPCETNGWNIGGKALYLQSSYSEVAWLGQQSVTNAGGTNRLTARLWMGILS